LIDDVLNNKAAIIERCLVRIKEEYVGYEKEIKTNFTKQDSIILNIERAAQACIDMGTHVIRKKHLGIPQTSREVFSLLEEFNYISKELSLKLQSMVGFRNIAVPDYQKLNLDIVISIVEKRLSDFLDFSSNILKDKRV
jgi:uncharacterized protein YutE (UPF0331/DUF86 family)